ncbi:MAG: TolC family protein [Planctomycetota bacterium]
MGCSRAFYRQQADTQANCLIDQKAALVGSEPGTLRIEIDPRSRMFSPEIPDRPAMPPDDPVAHAFLECVDGKRGAKVNRFAERTAFVENPNWRAFLPQDDEGQLVIDLTAAVEIGLLQSPEYQFELEDLYLSALEVSFERFQFDTQFFGGSSIFYTADGRVRSGTGDSSSLLEVSPSNPASPLQLQKLTASGGELVAGFANSLIWQFAGPDDYTSTTLLDFTLLQPLLRTGGRAFVLERLTFGERALLANVRTMERFRRGFYLNIATGAPTGPGPAPGGFGAVGGPLSFGSVGAIGVGAVGGYIGLLQEIQELRNERANVAALRASVDQLEASFDAGRIDRFQVDLARQALLSGQSRFLNAEAALQTSIDDFLITLGLPPNIDVNLSDTMLDAFQLRSLDLTALQTEAADLATEMRTSELDAVAGVENLEPPGDAGMKLNVLPDDGASEEIPPPTTPDSAAEARRQRCLALADDAREQLAIVEEDYRQLLAALPARRENLLLLSRRAEVVRAQIDPSVLSPERLDRRVDQLRRDLDDVGQRITKLAELILADEVATANDARLRTEELSSLLLELSLLQARARLDTIDIDPTDLSDEDALQIAMLYRRDLKNARASLVDSWRLINFSANDLLSDLDITFSGDIGNVGDNPFRLRDTNGRLRVGLEFDGPLTRLIERNNYRATLIDFQRARRGYYQFVDAINQDLRATLRQIRLNEIDFELSREAVLVAISQVDLTQLRLSEPPKPGEENQVSSTTARDLVDALADLLSVQNDFLAVWVGNEVARLSLEFDLGLMQLDAAGQRVPLGVPLSNFLNAVPCAAESCPERLPADIQALPLKPAILPPNADEAIEELGPGELAFPIDSSEEASIEPEPLRFDPALLRTSYQAAGPATDATPDRRVPRRLPPL